MLSTMTVTELLTRATELDNEATEFEASGCLGLARVKRRDAEFYRQLARLRGGVGRV